MFKKTIISLLILEVLLIVGIFVSIAHDAKEEPEVKVEEVVTFTDSNGVNTEVDIVVFNETANETYTENVSFEIHMELLDNVDTHKVVDLIDSGLTLEVFGNDLTTQEIGNILGIEDITKQSVSGAELTRLTIYKSANGYGCIMGGEVVAEKISFDEAYEKMNQPRQKYEIYCYSDNLNVGFSPETFNSAGMNDFEKIEHIRIDTDVLPEIDSSKLVELMDSGIIISVRGKDITPQEVITTLGLEDICSFNAEDKKADSVKIYKDDDGYICEKGGIDKVYKKDGTEKIIETD